MEEDSGDSSGGSSYGGYGDRKMYKAVCSDCGQECEVPFEPTDGRPVYCRDCFQKHRKPRTGGGGGGYGGGRGGGGGGGGHRGGGRDRY